MKARGRHASPENDPYSLKVQICSLTLEWWRRMNAERDGRRTTRSCKKLIRFTPSELERVNARARAVGQPVACYIREVSLGTRKRAAGATSTSQTIVHRLSQAATRLCALRDLAMATGLPASADFGKAVEELLDLIRNIE